MPAAPGDFPKPRIQGAKPAAHRAGVQPKAQGVPPNAQFPQRWNGVKTLRENKNVEMQKSRRIDQWAHLRNAPVFSLASPKGGEGRGEEAQGFTAQIPSPRSGGERETDAVSSCALDPLACD